MAGTDEVFIENDGRVPGDGLERRGVKFGLCIADGGIARAQGNCAAHGWDPLSNGEVRRGPPKRGAAQLRVDGSTPDARGRTPRLRAQPPTPAKRTVPAFLSGGCPASG